MSRAAARSNDPYHTLCGKRCALKSVGWGGVIKKHKLHIPGNLLSDDRQHALLPTNPVSLLCESKQCVVSHVRSTTSP